jgi:hypothetical protein
MRDRLVSALFAVTLWLGCEGGLFTIHVEEEAETTVPAGSLLEQLLGDLGFEGFLDMDVTASEELRNQGVEPGDVQDVRLESFDLSTVGQGDLAFIESLDVYVSAPDLDEVLVASVAGIPDGATYVALTVEDVDLTAYVVSRSMTFTTDITGHRPEEETTVKAEISLAVGVTGQGACHQLQDDTEGG